MFYALGKVLVNAGAGFVLIDYGLRAISEAGQTLGDYLFPKTEACFFFIPQEPDCCRRRTPEKDSYEEDEIVPVETESKFEREREE